MVAEEGVPPVTAPEEGLREGVAVTAPQQGLPEGVAVTPPEQGLPEGVAVPAPSPPLVRPAHGDARRRRRRRRASGTARAGATVRAGEPAAEGVSPCGAARNMNKRKRWAFEVDGKPFDLTDHIPNYTTISYRKSHRISRALFTKETTSSVRDNRVYTADKARYVPPGHVDHLIHLANNVNIFCRIHIATGKCVEPYDTVRLFDSGE